MKIKFLIIVPNMFVSGEEVFAQGVCGIFNDMIAVGLSSGRIIIFKKDSGAFVKHDTLQGTHHCYSWPPLYVCHA